MDLAPGTRLVMRVTAVNDDTVMMINEDGHRWRKLRHGDFADAKVGDVYDIEIRAKKPTEN